MTKLLTILAASALTLTLTSWHINAADTSGAVDNGPPAQQQKNQLPDSTSTGDYLETQPDENGATQDTSEKHKNTANQNKNTTKKSTKKGVKATNIEKSKRMTLPPEEGGTNVKQ